MTDCPNCKTARERRWYGGYTAACVACHARLISRGPACAEAKKRGVITSDYLAELRAAAEADHSDPMVVHDMVRAWQRVDAEARAR